jgi:hypothetical protein
MDSTQKIVLLKSFDLAIDAGLAKAKLDAHGIPCFISNESGVYPIPTNSMFSVRLMVFQNDMEKANEILLDQSEQ